MADVFDAIEEIRRKNNTNWMALLRLAFEVAPNRSKEIMGRITKCDERIRELCQELKEK